MPQTNSDPPEERLQAMVERIVAGGPSPYHVPALFVAGRSLDGRSVRAAAGRDEEGQAIDETSLFPTTCVTKSVLVYALLSLVRDRALDLDLPIGSWLPELPERTRSLTLRALLSHTAGMGVIEDLPYGPELDHARIMAVCLSSVPEHPPGNVRYSNAGFAIVASVLERVVNAPLEVVFDRLAAQPLCLDAHFTLPASRTAIRVAEIRSDFAATDLEPLNSPFWRNLKLPWAGLLMPAESLFRIAEPFHRAWRGEPGFGFLREAVVNQTASGPGGFPPDWRRLGYHAGGAMHWPECPWGLGFEVRGPKRPHWTPRGISPESFGLLGSSGCLLWVDPTRGITWVILGARSTDGGWMLRHGPRLGEAILACFPGESPSS